MKLSGIIETKGSSRRVLPEKLLYMDLIAVLFQYVGSLECRAEAGTEVAPRVRAAKVSLLLFGRTISPRKNADD